MGDPPAPARKRTSELAPGVKSRARERRNRAKRARRQALQFLTTRLIDIAASGGKFSPLESEESEAARLAQEVLAQPIEEADLEQLTEVFPSPSTTEEVVGLAARTESKQELDVHRTRLRESLGGGAGEVAAAALDRL